MDTVTRYVATYVNKDGMRTLMSPAQGRCTFETAKEAQGWIYDVTSNMSRSGMASIWGPEALDTFEVRPCACYPGHFDPIGVWFD